jgi:biopolymer transport protein ExbD
VRIELEQDGEEPSINLTPMIDVVLQLLVFFLLATTFLDPERSLDVELPASDSGSAPEHNYLELVIDVQRDGSLALGGRALTSAELARELAGAAERDPGALVTIRGHRAVAHQEIVRVMDACRRAGFADLALGTIAEL